MPESRVAGAGSEVKPAVTVTGGVPRSGGRAGVARTEPRQFLEVQGRVARVGTEGRHDSHRGGGKRGRVRAFTHRSRRRVQEKLGKLEMGEGWVMVTLTFPDWEWVGTGPECKARLRAMRKRLMAKGVTAGMWRMEPQERGVPHFHLLCYGETWLSQEWVVEQWGQVLGYDGPGPICHVTWVRTMRRMTRYVTRYAGKAELRWEQRAAREVRDTTRAAMGSREAPGKPVERGVGVQVDPDLEGAVGGVQGVLVGDAAGELVCDRGGEAAADAGGPGGEPGCRGSLDHWTYVAGWWEQAGRRWGFWGEDLLPWAVRVVLELGPRAFWVLRRGLRRLRGGSGGGRWSGKWLGASAFTEGGSEWVLWGMALGGVSA